MRRVVVAMVLAARGAAAEPVAGEAPGQAGAMLATPDPGNAGDGGETIEVSGELPPPAPGAGKLSRADLERLPGGGNDAIRALDAMPGVVSFPLPLGDAGVAIRGSSPQDSKILVDGFEIPMLYHVIGFRSIVPAEAIDQIDYIPGGFDVAFGRATSGIVELTTRAGADHRTEQAELSSADGGVLAQGRMPRGSYLLAFRRSVIDQLLPALLPDGLDLSLTTVPRYYDEQLRLDYAPSPAWTLRLSSVGSDDVLELYTSSTTAPDKRLYDRTRFARVTAAARYHDGAWAADLAISGIAEQTVFERGTRQRLSVTAPGGTARGELTRALGATAGLADLTWRLGGELAVARRTIDLALPAERREGEPAMPDDPMDTSLRFTGAIWTPDAAAWTAASASLDPRIRVTAGLRIDAFERVHEVAAQPRGELTVALTPAVTARLSAGAYRRPPEYQTELLDAHLAAERATQLVGGVSIAPRPGLRLQGSVYATDRSRLITRVGDRLANTGRGATHGAELFAILHDGPWFGWLSYAWSRSTRTDEPGGASRLFDYDQPHSLNVAASYSFGRWQLGGRFRLYSGLPQTPVLGAVFDSDANLYTPIYGAVNSERAPVHHELDLRLDRRWTWGPVQMTYFLDVQNVYLNQSAVGYLYSFDYQQRVAFRGLPILPSAGLRGEL
ncbi:MAG TPA: TonB-dependent receptor plug domain-containing protein [Kofleriaceae bacterium]|nr:TonB-dependent receptor plug domain-containing protein [Kofleriaceae bacterium]